MLSFSTIYDSTMIVLFVTENSLGMPVQKAKICFTYNVITQTLRSN